MKNTSSSRRRRHCECHRRVNLPPLAGLPFPLAKRFQGAVIQRRDSCRLNHYYFADSAASYIKCNSKQAIPSNMPRSQSVRILGSLLLDDISHPRHSADVVDSTMADSLCINCARQRVATLLCTQRRQDREGQEANKQQRWGATFHL